MREHVFELHKKVESMPNVISECEKVRQEIDAPKWSESAELAARALRGQLIPRIEHLNAEVDMLKTHVMRTQMAERSTEANSQVRSVRQDESAASTGSWERIRMDEAEMSRRGTQQASTPNRVSMLPESIRRKRPITQAGPGFNVTMGTRREDEGNGMSAGELGQRVHINVMSCTQTTTQEPLEAQSGPLHMYMNNMTLPEFQQPARPEVQQVPAGQQRGSIVGRVGNLFGYVTGTASSSTPIGGGTTAPENSNVASVYGGGLFSNAPVHGAAPVAPDGGGSLLGGVASGALPTNGGFPSGAGPPNGFPPGGGPPNGLPPGGGLRGFLPGGGPPGTGPPGGGPPGGGPPGGPPGNGGLPPVGVPWHPQREDLMTFNKDFPKLKEHPGSPWKKQTEFLQWMNKIMTYANGVHSKVGGYVAHCMRNADDYFSVKKIVPDGNIDQGWTEVDHKLVAVCLLALPDRISADCYKQGKNETFTQVIYNVLCILNPGGAKEIECLTKFCRTPPSAKDAQSVREVMEDWVVARHRLKAIGSVDMIPKERYDAMGMMVDQLCKQNHQFRTSWETRRAMMGPGFHDHADDAFADGTEAWLRHELKGMESNELMEVTQDPQNGTQRRQWQQMQEWTHESYPRVNAVDVQPRGVTEGQPKDNRQYFACYTFKADGVCTKKDCPYSHDPSTWREFKKRNVGEGGKGEGKGGKGKGQTEGDNTLSAKRVTVVRLSVPINEVSTRPDRENDRGLLDSGASEIVRPYNWKWHQAIKEGRCKGSDVPVCLAGGVMKTGVMTSTGEVMIPRDSDETQGWILPMGRIVEELGGAVAWDVDKFKIEFPSGKVVKAIERGDGLRYVDERDLQWIRQQLVTSHLGGRRAANLVRINKIVREDLIKENTGKKNDSEMSEENCWSGKKCADENCGMKNKALCKRGLMESRQTPGGEQFSGLPSEMKG